MKRSYLILFLMLGFISSALAQTTPWSLKQCVETALSANATVQQQLLTTRTDSISLAQARMNRWPSLSGVAAAGINQGRSIDPFTNAYSTEAFNYANYGLAGEVTLFAGFSMRNTVLQNALYYKASKMSLRQQQDDITVQVILAYLGVLDAEDMIQQSSGQLVFTGKQVERLELMNKEGAIAPSQLYDMRGQYASEQIANLNAQKALVAAKISLCRLLNEPLDTSFRVERIEPAALADRYTSSPDSIYAIALRQFAQVKAVDLRRESAIKGVLAARGTFAPVLSLEGNLNTNYSSVATQPVLINTSDKISDDYVLVGGTPSPVVYRVNNFQNQRIAYGKQLSNNLFSSISLNLRIPIFNRNIARNRVGLARLDLAKAELDAGTTKTALQLAIRQAYSDMEAAVARYRLLLDQVKAYRESFRAAEVRYNAGAGTSLDYLNAKNNLNTAEINLVNAQYESLYRMKVLDYYQGKPLF